MHPDLEYTASTLSPDAAVLVDAAGQVAFWNSGAERIFGYSAEEATGRSLIDLIVPNDTSERHRQISDLLKKGEAATYDASKHRKDGSLVYVDVSITPAETLGPHAYLFTAKDITQLKIRRDAKLIAARYRDILELAPDGIVMANPTGHIVFANGHAERLFGYDSGDLVGETIESLLPPRFRSGHVGYRTQYFGQPRTRTMGAGLELFGLRKDQTEFPVEISLSPFHLDDATLVMSAIRDITARKKAETKFRALLEGAPDAMVIVDRDGHISIVNGQTEAMFGYARGELLGQKVEMLLPSRFHGNHPSHRSHFFANPKARPMGANVDLFGRRKNGDEFPVEISLSPLETEDGIFASASIRDISERKIAEKAIEQKNAELTRAQLQIEITRREQAEADTRQRDHMLSQLHKMDAVGQLTGGIAHDFNNLLTAIRGTAEDLTEELTGSAELHRLAQTVLQAADRGAELVRQLLAFARKQELHPRIISVNTLLEGVVRLLRRALQENIIIKLELGRGVPTVNADPATLENVLMNLVFNARDAMPDGGTVTIETRVANFDAEYVATASDVREGTHVEIDISDTGIGMTRDVIDRAFEPFFTTKAVGKGTGLGLSMVYGFVKQSGGHAKIYSEVGRGTTVKVYLPASDAPVSEPEPAPASEGRPLRNNGARILLIEDDELVRMSVELKLTRMGYIVTAVDGPTNGFAALNRASFDLVFTDVIMPGSITGADVAREILLKWPDVGILVTSGYTESALLGKVKIPPGVGLLSKPYSNAELENALKAALEQTRTMKL